MTGPKRDTLAKIETEARALARSGHYRGFRAVQHQLIVSGYSEAEQLFQNRWQQVEIDRICELSYASGLRQTATAANQRGSDSLECLLRNGVMATVREQHRSGL
jgi:hypothetical protein